MTFEQLQNANKDIKTTDIKGKAYAEVPQRIKVFRMLFPCGTIQTELLSVDNGVCIMKASVYDENMKLLGTGTAYEKEDSTFINKTSYIENCETSAVGRALAMCGIGIDTSIASAEEVTNAINNQQQEEQAFNQQVAKNMGEPATEPQKKAIYAICKKHNVNTADLFALNNITDETMTKGQATNLINSLKKKFGE